ncbi:hypothetical protein EW145_g2526 [Phellinidium pouzarii]|uniref:TERF2-interacting telomeric protein 1 Myb domain-containing protein n=1 Tax=Phellinidium pouzarii TaxID=167371 RepID=A0A4V3XD85_9AGAM|nr:hypothetical protein EW145_g2526 [Phellinidium pouzarii]
MRRARTNFDQDDDALLVKYIARYNPEKAGRLGNALYKSLVEDSGNRWRWAKRHSWQSWRERYKSYEYKFDSEIKQYQKKKGIFVGSGENRNSGPRYTSTVMLEERINEDRDDEENTRSDGDVANVIAQGTSHDSDTRRSASRKTTNGVQRIEENVGACEEEEGVKGDTKIRSGQVERGEGNSRKGKEKATLKRKLSDASKIEAKRQKVEDLSHAVQVRREKASNESTTSKGRNLGMDVEMAESHDISKGTNQPSTTIEDLGQQSTPKIQRTEEFMSALKALSAFVAKDKLPGPEDGDPLGSKVNGHVEGKPDRPPTSRELTIQLNGVAVPGTEDSVVDTAVLKMQDVADDTNPPDGAFLSDPHSANAGLSPISPENNIKPPLGRERPLKSRRDEEDYFASPSPTPIKPASRSSASVSAPPVSSATTAKSLVSTKRKPSRILNGAFNSTYAFINARRAPSSYEHATDLNSDSDSDATPSWPPRRDKKEMHAGRTPISSPTAAAKGKHANFPTFLASSVSTEETAKNNKEALLSLPQAGPSKMLPHTDLQVKIHEWRLDTPTPEGLGPGVSSAVAKYPLLSGDVAYHVHGEKGKEESVLNDVNTNGDRRMTFGGFTTLPTSPSLPEFDLREKGLRRNSLLAEMPSLDAQRSLSSSGSSSGMNRSKKRSRLSRNRISFTSTIDLTEEFPSPGIAIAPTDQVLVNRAGLQFFVQTMAQNHGISEEWVRRVYEERRDLQGTDRILAEIRAAAERAFNEAIEREIETGKMQDSKPKSTSDRSLPQQYINVATASNPGEQDQKQMRTGERELDLSGLQRPQHASSGSRQQRELLFTPADADASLARARARYAPPSTSRAARYVRRVRQNSGMSSPLKPSVEDSNTSGEGLDDGDEDGNDEEEEGEVSMSLTRSRALADVLDAMNAPNHAVSAMPESTTAVTGNGSVSHHHSNNIDTSTIVSRASWTVDEDAVLMNGEDEAAIQAVVGKRGHGPVKRRIVELMMNDGDLFS